MEMSATAKDCVICMTAPNISCGFIAGRVTYHSSCQRFLMPSMAAASYMLLSTVCKPAMKDRKPVPRLSHS